MKLEKIKLSGFKSFVDPTTIPINGNLTAIVGPNGCGKSNIIDAVRWVMGESSAKHLRGGNMTDVIFNGSSGRKPVNMATVELIFDNSAGTAGGEYAQYNSISIKRQVSRDGTSLFMLNGARCRRKDITDLFLGTGLGSRSYAIIEQGTISRMVEAKPEDLRLHIEEAAGVSKYKERRAETETRMRHTRENLERLADLRDEVDKQVKNLAKQAQKAEKYTELKQQERQFRLELLAMRWQAFNNNCESIEQNLQTVAIEHNRLFVLLRETENNINAQRNAQKTKQVAIDASQRDYYELLSEIGRLEQTIKHQEQSQHDLKLEIERLTKLADQAKIACDQDRIQLEEIRQTLLEAEETLTMAKEREEELLGIKQDADTQKQLWQAKWEAFLNHQALVREKTEIQRVKIQQLDNQNRQLLTRLDKLNLECHSLKEKQLSSDLKSMEAQLEMLETERDSVQEKLHSGWQHISALRPNIKESQSDLHLARADLQKINGQISSLELLQQHAMGKDNTELNGKLALTGLINQPRLVEFLEVESGWETAVENVLGDFLQAICVENITEYLTVFAEIPNQSLFLYSTDLTTQHKVLTDKSTLLSKINSPLDLSSLILDVFCADNLITVQETQLKANESVVMPDGLCFGKNWIKQDKGNNKTGILQREKDLRHFKQCQIDLNQTIQQFEETLESFELALKTAEVEREQFLEIEKRLNLDLARLNSDFSVKSAKLEQENIRIIQLETEIIETQQQLFENQEGIAEAELIKQTADHELLSLVEKKTELEKLNQQLQLQELDCNASVTEASKHLQRLFAQIESLKSSEILTLKQIERLQLQHMQSAERIKELDLKLETSLRPLDSEKNQWLMLIDRKNQLAKNLDLERETQEEYEQNLYRLQQQQLDIQQALDKQKTELDKLRFEQQDSQVRQQTIAEQIKEMDGDLESILHNLDILADELKCKSKVDQIVAEIEKLGAINLTAIEEYKTQFERLKFLQEQYIDLTEALKTLEQAIYKIDKETRQRFQDTFNKINSGLQEKFPRLFGGGIAYLELTDQDVLEAGVNIIARPPGKKNSSIHLLSGGEKALTAVALVFSIFELNPAPFCLLDEVDAPLDDANVVRFSKMVEDMSSTVQFLYISHNKVTMEIAKHLAGVTMKEPGVSRMVAVDIEEAVNMAES